MILVRNLFASIIVFTFLTSCDKELAPVLCPSDTLRYIVSNGVRLKINYDSLGRVSSVEPSNSMEPFSFRAIKIYEKATFFYGLDNRLSEINFGSGQYMKFSYGQNVISRLINLNYQSGQYVSLQDPVGNIVNQHRIVRIYVGVNYYDQTVPMGSFNYSNGNVVKFDLNAQDFNNLSRIATTYSYSYDSSPNPLYGVLRFLSITEDPILLSMNNCTSAKVEFSYRGALPLGERINQLRYDAKGRLVYFKSGENEKDELSFSYCKE